jgi:hypothetical protein
VRDFNEQMYKSSHGAKAFYFVFNFISKTKSKDLAVFGGEIHSQVAMLPALHIGVVTNWCFSRSVSFAISFLQWIT